MESIVCTNKCCNCSLCVYLSIFSSNAKHRYHKSLFTFVSKAQLHDSMFLTATLAAETMHTTTELNRVFWAPLVSGTALRLQLYMGAMMHM